MWRIRVPASSANLGSGLDLLGMAIDVWLDLSFVPARQLSIEVNGQGKAILPLTEENLVWKSADHVHRNISGNPMPRGHLTVSSDIPLGRGMGSSAAAVVAGIMLANAVMGNPLDAHEIFQWATEIEGHPDNVGAALYGGVILAWKEDSGQYNLEHFKTPDLDAILVIPDYLVRTREARTLLPNSVPRADAIFNASRVALWIHSLHTNNWSLLRHATEDRLHQPFRKALIHGMDDLFSCALSAGAIATAISGSGPTVIALSPIQATDAVCASLAHLLSQQSMFSTSIKRTRPSMIGGHLLQEDNHEQTTSLGPR